jgi:hypothetical protein
MQDSATPFTYIAIHAEGASGTEVVLVKRRLIQTWMGGRPSNPVIPRWAGQWGIVCGQQDKPQSIQKTAYAAFLAQTGIDLGDPLVAARYGVTATATQHLQDANYNPIPAVYIACHVEGMRALQKDIQQNIDAQKVQDGVLETTAIKRTREAEQLIGPVPPPPEGWRRYVIANYYGGKPPALNPPIDAQTKILAERSAKTPDGFQVVIEHTPAKSNTHPDDPAGTPVKTAVQLINTTPGRINLTASIASASDWASTTDRPDANLASLSLEGMGSLIALEEVASSATSAIYTLTADVPRPDGDGRESFYFRVDQTLADTGTPDMRNATELPTGGEYVGAWGVLQVAGSIQDGLPGLQIYIITPGG